MQTFGIVILNVYEYISCCYSIFIVRSAVPLILHMGDSSWTHLPLVLQRTSSVRPCSTLLLLCDRVYIFIHVQRTTKVCVCGIWVYNIFYSFPGLKFVLSYAQCRIPKKNGPVRSAVRNVDGIKSVQLASTIHRLKILRLEELLFFSVGTNSGNVKGISISIRISLSLFFFCLQLG